MVIKTVKQVECQSMGWLRRLGSKWKGYPHIHWFIIIFPSRMGKSQGTCVPYDIYIYMCVCVGMDIDLHMIYHRFGCEQRGTRVLTLSQIARLSYTRVHQMFVTNPFYPWVLKSPAGNIAPNVRQAVEMHSTGL